MFKTICRLFYKDQTEISRKLGSYGVFDVYTAHKFVYTLFPRELNADFSFNAELEDENGRLIVINSNVEPDLTGFEKYDIRILNVELPESGDIRQFLVAINSAKRVPNQKYFKPVKSDEFSDWFKVRAENAGFEVVPDTLKIIRHYDKNFTDKTSTNRRIYVTTCSGILRVTDSNKFKSACISGIGREKAYGLGLIAIN